MTQKNQVFSQVTVHVIHLGLSSFVFTNHSSIDETFSDIMYKARYKRLKEMKMS